MRLEVLCSWPFHHRVHGERQVTPLKKRPRHTRHNWTRHSILLLTKNTWNRQKWWSWENKRWYITPIKDTNTNQSTEFCFLFSSPKKPKHHIWTIITWNLKMDGIDIHGKIEDSLSWSSIVYHTMLNHINRFCFCFSFSSSLCRLLPGRLLSVISIHIIWVVLNGPHLPFVNTSMILSKSSPSSRNMIIIYYIIWLQLHIIYMTYIIENE